MGMSTIRRVERKGEQLGARLSKAGSLHGMSQTRVVQSVSHGQKALWFMQQMNPASAAYNEAFAWRIRSQVDVEALRRAFQGVVDRHPVLRTTFPSRAGQPCQRIHGRAVLPFAHVDAANWSDAQLDSLLTTEAHRPFDLENDIPIRLLVASVSSTEHVMLLVMHHVAMDLWSLGVMLEELRVLYDAARKGVAPPPAKSQTTYADFVGKQANMLAGPEGKKIAAYWEQQLAGELPVLNLSTDHPRPPVQTYNGASHAFDIDDDLAEGIRQFAKTEGVTPFMVVLAAYQVMLHRYTGQEDILVGSPTAGRIRPEYRRTIGYFVNPVVLRGDLSGNPTFKEFLARVRRTVLGALSHQEFPFPLLVEKLQPVRDPSRSPLFQANFAWERPIGGIDGRRDRNGSLITSFRLGDLELESYPLKQDATKFDLTLMVLETGRSLSGSFHYNRDLWQADSIARMAGHFRMLLRGIVAHPERPVGEWDILTDEEKQRFSEWNNTAREFPKDVCIHRLLEAQAARTPEAQAVVLEDKSLTYEALNGRANQLARHLQMLGVGPETCVGVFMERSLDTVVTILGILKAGGAYVPLDPVYPKDRLAFMVEDAAMPVIVTHSRLEAELPPHRARIVPLDVDWEAISRHSTENLDGTTTSDNLAYVIFTSGSTGKPKGVLVTHRGIGNLAQAQIRAFDVTAESRVLQFASLNFDASVSEIVMALCAGATLVLGTPETLMPGPGLIRLLQEQEITTVTLPPSVLANMPADEFPRLRTVVAAGEACPAEVVARWAPGRKFLNAYGPTENTVCASMAVCEPDGRRPNIGKPMDNVQIFILDSRRQPVPVGVPGELHIAGIGLARGYLNRPELTAEKFIASPFSNEAGARLYRTGDLARWLLDGTIDFLGRIDHQVKIRGFRIELEEIDATLAQHQDISEAVVLARADEGSEKRLVAYYVPAQGAAPSISELRRFLKSKLPEHMIPAAFVRMDAFPLSPNGKVDRKKLPAPDASRPELEQAYVAPETETQKTIAGIWGGILGIDKIGIHDNFFELGGASIQVLQVAERAQEAGLPLTPEYMFQFQTIAELETVLG